MKIVKITVRAAALLLLCAVLLCGCAKVGDFSVNKKIVCEVGGEPVTYDEYKYFFYSHHCDLYGSADVPLTDEMFGKVKALTEDSLRRRATIMALVDEYGVKLEKEDKKYADTVVESQIELYGSEQGYIDFLLDGRATGRVFRDQVMLTFKYDPALREVFSMGVNKDIKLTEADMLASVTGGGFYHYQYAYFPLTEGKNSYDLEKEANDFYNGLINGTKSFEKEDYDAIGQRALGFEKAVLELEEGDMSGVVWGADWSDYAGYYIFKRLPIDVEQVKNNMGKYDIEDEYFAATYLDYISEQSKSVKIEYSKYFDTLTYMTLVKREEQN